MPSHALLVHGDRTDAVLLGSYLAQNGFAVQHASDLRRALDHLDGFAFDAVIVDASSPALDTARVLTRARQRRATAAIVITDAQAVIPPDLELLVDEWLRRPWVLTDALARVQLALARRALVIATQHVIAGDVVLDVGHRLARYRGRELTLTALEFDLLVALARSIGMPVARSALRMIASSRRPLQSERSLDVHICHLRAKLRGTRGPNPIRTVRGVGYVLLHRVEPPRG